MRVKPSLAQKLKLIFKFSTTIEAINVPLWTHMGHKRWREDGKTFIRWNYEMNLMPIFFYYISQVIAK